ncbi:MAG: ROK family protein [Gammaproteobacteria bacterium]|nr:ROK family protein [Gammaproteobacteria bacterium]
MKPAKELQHERPLRLGIDLGGTKIEAALIDGDGRFVARERQPTPAMQYHDICTAIGSMVSALEQRHGRAWSVGIGMPGAISPASGLVKNANTACLNGRPFARDIATVLGREVRLANDANCLVLSEHQGGAADGAQSAFGVILGTGTGGALLYQGDLIVGANAIAGEWGHNRVPWNIACHACRTCYCGRTDCIETYLSGAGLERSYREAGGAGIAVGVTDIATRAATGEKMAQTILADYAASVAQCLAQVVNVFDPEVVVLAGGLSNLPALAATVAASLPQHVFSDCVATRVVTAAFGDSSGVRGAASLWGRPDSL